MTRTIGERLQEHIGALLTSPEGMASFKTRLNESQQFSGKGRLLSSFIRIVEKPRPEFAALPLVKRQDLLLTVAERSVPKVDQAHWDALWLLLSSGHPGIGEMAMNSLKRITKNSKEDLGQALMALSAWQQFPTDRRVRLLEVAKQRAESAEEKDRIGRALNRIGSLTNSSSNVADRNTPLQGNSPAVLLEPVVTGLLQKVGTPASPKQVEPAPAVDSLTPTDPVTIKGRIATANLGSEPNGRAPSAHHATTRSTSRSAAARHPKGRGCRVSRVPDSGQPARGGPHPPPGRASPTVWTRRDGGAVRDRWPARHTSPTGGRSARSAPPSPARDQKRPRPPTADYPTRTKPRRARAGISTKGESRTTSGSSR